MTLKQRILQEYKKLKTVRQSYGEIAKKLGCEKSYVYRVVKAQKSLLGAEFET